MRCMGDDRTDMEYAFNYKRIILRPITEDDIEWIRQLRNQPQIRQWFFHTKELTVEEQRKWYETYVMNNTDYMYIAELADGSNQRVGTCAVYNFDEEMNEAETGRLMVDSFNVSQRGLGNDIVGAIVNLAFTYFSVERIKAEVLSDNKRSLICHKTGGGFRVVGEIERDGRKVSLLEVTRQEYNSNFEREFK